MNKKMNLFLSAIVCAISLIFALASCEKTPTQSVKPSESQITSDDFSDSRSTSDESNKSDTDSETTSNENKEYITEALFSSLQGKARFAGDYIYDHSVDEYDKTFRIETVFGGENISQTESDKATGEVYYDYVYGKDNRFLTVIQRTIDNKIVIQTSKDLFENYYNPFDLLSAKDFVKIDENSFSLEDKNKAKKAASALTGWSESIVEFTVTISDGKAVSAHIVTDKIKRIASSDDFYVSTYDFEITDHGTAKVDDFKLNPYPHDASHELLQSALEKAAEKTYYTIRHQGHEVGYKEPEGGETRPGYGDTDYKVYITADMVYDSYKGEEHGYKLMNGYVYPFEYNSVANEVVLKDPVGQDINSFRSAFDGFKVELFKSAGENVYVPHNNAIASIIAPMFAVGNEKAQYSYAQDFRIELKDGELYRVIFTYKTYGIEETVTLTYDFETETDFSFLDFENATKTSVLDPFLGQYKDENGHFLNVDKSGFTLDGEEIKITNYLKDENGVPYFIGTWKGEEVSIVKFSSKQIVVQNDSLTIMYTLTAVETQDVEIPDKYKGTWKIYNDKENIHLDLIVQSRAVYLNGDSIGILSYTDKEGLALKSGDDTLYLFDVSEDDDGKYLTAMFLYSDSTYIRFSFEFVTDAIGVEIPKEYVGTYMSDDYRNTVIITDSQITINGIQFIPARYNETDGFTGTYNNISNYFVVFKTMFGTTDKDKLIIGTDTTNYELNRVASPKENYIGTWKSDPEIDDYDYTVVFTETSLTINGKSYPIDFDRSYGYKIEWNDPSMPYTAYILFYYNRYGNPSMIMYDDNGMLVNLFKQETTKIPSYLIGTWRGRDEVNNIDAEVSINKDGDVIINAGEISFAVRADYADDILTFTKAGKLWSISYNDVDKTINLFRADAIDATLTRSINYTVPKALYGSWENGDGVSFTITGDGITFVLNGNTEKILEATIKVSGSGSTAVYNISFTLNGLNYEAEYGSYGTSVMIMVYENGEYKTYYSLSPKAE